MRKKVFLLIALAFWGLSLVGCGVIEDKNVSARIVPPQKVFSKEKYGVCFDANELKKLNPACNLNIEN